MESVTFQSTLDGVPDDAWDVSEAKDRSVLAWMDGGNLYVAANGRIAPNPNASWMFAYFINLKEIYFGNCFDTAKVTNMYRMFSDCSNLTSLDLSSFDTSRVTDMGDMFQLCWNLTNLDVSGFDTANVINMHGMFDGNTLLAKLDVSSFDTANVTDMSNMFSMCGSLTSLDVSGFDTANVTNMWDMFNGCSGLTSLELSGFDASNVTDMHDMFAGSDNLTNLKCSDKKIRVEYEKVFPPVHVMAAAENLSRIYDAGSDQFFWGQTKYRRGDVKTVSFQSTLSGAPGNAWDVSEARDRSVLAWMNGGNLYVAANGKIAPNSNASYMFAHFESLKGIDFGNCFDTANVTNMGFMFDYCWNLTSLDVSGFNTANVTDMSCMFCECNSLTSLDVSGFDTANVANMGAMFYNCLSLINLDVSSFDTANVTSMFAMFCGCSRLTSLDLSGFDSANVTEMSDMFTGSDNLANLKCSDKKILAEYNKRNAVW